MREFCIGLLLLCAVGAEASAEVRAIEAATNYVAERFNLDRESIFVTMRENSSFDDLAPTDSLRVCSNSTSPPRGSYPMKFEIMRDGVVTKTISASIQVAFRMEAYVAGRKIKRGEALEPADIFVECRDVTKFFDRIVQTTESLASVRASRSINAGTVIRNDMIEPIPTVCRGDEVIIRCEIGAMEIRTTGTAKEDGLRGDEIDVVNCSTRKRITAEVEAPGVVVIVR